MGIKLCANKCSERGAAVRKGVAARTNPFEISEESRRIFSVQAKMAAYPLQGRVRDSP